MEKYGLIKEGWKFDFGLPRATKKRYQVDWEKKEILLAQKLKSCASHAAIRNVMLLAIAVVVVGPYAGEAATLEMSHAGRRQLGLVYPSGDGQACASAILHCRMLRRTCTQKGERRLRCNHRQNEPMLW